MGESKVIIITGASDGIGRQAARDLAAAGHRVVIVGRSPRKTAALAEELGAPAYTADFADLSQVRELALRLRGDFPHIDVLCNNAGGLFPRDERTVDGHQKTFQVNHLAPFLLTYLLLDTLIRSRASVIMTSSVAHRLIAHYRPDDLDMARFPSLHAAYGNSKLENILFSRELDRRFHGEGLSSAAYHPGVVASSFALDAPSPMRLVYGTGLKRLLGLVSPREGADTLVWLAAGEPGRDWRSGGYYIKRHERKPSRKARSGELARRLWDDSLRLCAPFLDGEGR
ncbi:MAG: SDR family NAD(P)-dependent oxidoreductase [Christensenellales bacterium]